MCTANIEKKNIGVVLNKILADSSKFSEKVRLKKGNKRGKFIIISLVSLLLPFNLSEIMTWVVKSKKKNIEKRVFKKSPNGKVITSKKNDHLARTSNESLEVILFMYKLTSNRFFRTK